MEPGTPIQEEEEEEAVPSSSDLHADILQTVFSYLPYPDLVAASFVSHEWRRHVHLSLLAHPRPHPWLLLHLRHSPYDYAFDPHSSTWFHLSSSSPPLDAAQIQASHPAMLYQLSPSSLSVSLDPLAGAGAGAWLDLGPPRSWRLHPLVVLVGAHQVVVAGGYDPLDDGDPLAVDVYSVVAPGDRRRRSCRPLPAAFKNSSSRVWLSAAASETRMFVLEKSSGEFSALDLAAGEWSPATHLRPDPCIYYSVIGYSDGRLLLLGLVGTAESPTGLRIWEVQNNTHDRSSSYVCTKLGEMPASMLVALVARSPDGELPEVEMCAMGGMVYVYNQSDPGEIAHCEVSGDGLYKWGIHPNPALDSDDNRLGGFVFTCSRVGIDRLREAYLVKNGV